MIFYIILHKLCLFYDKTFCVAIYNIGKSIFITVAGKTCDERRDIVGNLILLKERVHFLLSYH